MKQNQDQIPKIYQELGRQLHLPETRIAALEQQIREKAAEQEQKHSPAAFIRAEKHRFGTENWLAYRIAPLVACAVLAVTGTMIYRTTTMKPAEYETADSDLEIAEETVTVPTTGLTTDGGSDAGTVTTIVTVTGRETAGSGTDTAASESAAEQTTETETAPQPEETEAETAADTTVLQADETTAAPKQTTLPAASTGTVTTLATTEEPDPEGPPVQTEIVTLPLQEIEIPETPADAVFALDNVRAHAGERVTVSVYVPQEMSVFGFQFPLQLSALSVVPLPEIVSYEIPAQRLRLPLTTNLLPAEGFMFVGFADDTEYLIPAGTELFRMTLLIPEDAPSGTVYRLIDLTEGDAAYKAVSREYPSGIPGPYYIGSVYVE